jgi:hypothetical protein
MLKSETIEKCERGSAGLFDKEFGTDGGKKGFGHLIN